MSTTVNTKRVATIPFLPRLFRSYASNPTLYQRCKQRRESSQTLACGLRGPRWLVQCAIAHCGASRKFVHQRPHRRLYLVQYDVSHATAVIRYSSARQECWSVDHNKSRNCWYEMYESPGRPDTGLRGWSLVAAVVMVPSTCWVTSSNTPCT